MTKTDQQSVLVALRSALLAGDDLRDAHELVVVSRVERRRSTLYFVGVAAQPGATRWVVKQPRTATQQPDLASPLTAQEQHDALVALHDALDGHNVRFSAPRPIALLAEAGAFAMEFVDGQSIPQLLNARAVLEPQPLLDAVGSAAALLRVLHSIQPGPSALVGPERPTNDALGDGRHVLQRVGLPLRSSWFDAARPQHTQTSVLLHGDFAPENVVIASEATYCLDPALAGSGPRELDVVRFLTMLCDAPLFINTLASGPVGRLRRRMAAQFVESYYGAAGRPTSLQPMLVHSVALRWAQRHDHIFERGARAAAARTTVLRVYFSRLLTEVSSNPDWP